MTTIKLHPGDAFPELSVVNRSGESVTLGPSSGGDRWQAIFVYRGAHCPMCTRYLNRLEEHLEGFSQAGVDIVAVSADSAEQRAHHETQLRVSFPLYHGLTEAQMKTLGLYISDPRSEQETDHRFAEPGLFVVNEQGLLHVVDLSNNPFVRPEIDTLVRGLRWIRDPKNNYPIRGARAY
ncbi:peroxiredoxin-like family protein [Salinibius halmophilus]|uniref:peroxiredoxin-like family protein n=1 Tax=Salinibius halmophilus TaxID=1853216 RepID=UPI000E664696|nr:peroxiredoxin-like family protein [Salinibius halmophilus]